VTAARSSFDDSAICTVDVWTSGFVDDVTFSHGPMGDMERGLGDVHTGDVL